MAESTVGSQGKEFLQRFLEKWILEAQVEFRETKDTIIYNIISKDGASLSAKEETLDAFNSYGVPKTAKYIKSIVIRGEKRKTNVVNLANRLAKRFTERGKAIPLNDEILTKERIIPYSLQKIPSRNLQHRGRTQPKSSYQVKEIKRKNRYLAVSILFSFS